MKDSAKQDVFFTLPEKRVNENVDDSVRARERVNRLLTRPEKSKESTYEKRGSG